MNCTIKNIMYLMWAFIYSATRKAVNTWNILGMFIVYDQSQQRSGHVNYNLEQNCWENCILGQHFSKHPSCTGSSLSPFPWKQCCCVFKRKPDPWAFVGSNIELGEGVFFPQRRRLEIVLLRGKVDMMGKTFSSSVVRDCSHEATN